MAPQQESNKTSAAITPTMEKEEEGEEEDDEEEHRHGERPLLSACEQEEEEEDANKSLPLPVKRRSSSLSRSSRSGEQGQEEAPGPGAARSLSFSRLFSSFRMIATSSILDIDELAAAEDGCAEQWRSQSKRHQQQQPKPVCRTQSLPMTTISRRLHPHGSKKRVADSSSLRRFRVSSLSSVPVPLPESSPPPPSPSEEEEERGEEVGEEEAVCRICMVALLEEEEEGAAGDSVLKLECRCKGELALAHRRCALKWFGIKGNPNCDVCGHDVLNLPVTLRRLPVPPPPPPPPPPLAAGNGNGTGSQEEEEAERERRGFNRGVWKHGTVILVTVSMLAYFCFLEQLLVGDHGNAAAALAVSVPFAVVLGTFSALTTAGMPSSKRYVWAYSALQFLLVVLFTHLFYRYVKLQAVIAIILSAFAGFGVAICANAVLLQAAHWRAARRPPTPPSDPDHLHQTPQP